MIDVKHKGAQTELQVITYLHGLGYDVSIPFGDNARYDIILDTGQELLKIQIKTASLATDTNDTYLIKTCSTGINQHQNKIKPYTIDEIDYIGTFINDRVYLIPIENCGKKEKRLRFAPPKNNQNAKCNMAQDYEAEKILEERTNRK